MAPITTAAAAAAAVTSAEITTVAPPSRRMNDELVVTKLTIEPFESSVTKLAENLSTTATTTTPARLTTSISNAPIVEVISELDTPNHMPVIDLAPFARSKNAFDEPKSTTTTTTATTTLDDHPTSTTLGNSSTSSPQANSTLANHPELASPKPVKNFFEKADEFIERNLLNLKRVFQ